MYRPSSMVLDYTDFEEERLREKMFPHYITAGPPQREEIFFRERKNETVFKFHFLKYATMNE